MLTKRRAIVTVITLLLTLAIGIVAAWVGYMHYPVIQDDHGVRFVVREGASFRAVSNDLSKRHIILSPLILEPFGYIQKYRIFKAGEYNFPKGSTPLSILHQIHTGTGLVYYIFTIVPGWNFKQIREALQREEHIQQTIPPLTDTDVMLQIDQNNKVSPEGQFYPDSYYYTGNYPDIKLLKRAYKAMRDKLSTAWLTRAADVPYKNIYEALIAASLIEKEARFDSDRAIISGVIVNRLHKNMLLQIDPSVIYGLGVRYDGKIHKKDLLEDTPFNTYVHKGLPPTPIAMPGLASINAAMHPEKNTYIYYVARMDGHHQFSQSLAQHNNAIANLKNATIKNAIVSKNTTYNSNEFFNERLITERLKKLVKL